MTQLDKFDKDRAYVKRWIAERYRSPQDSALTYFEMIPQIWQMRPDAAYPDPVVTPEQGRTRALDAYGNRGF